MNQNRSIEEIQPLLETRRALFSLLRQTFITEPTPEFLQAIIKEIDFTDFPFSDVQEEIRDGAKLVAEFCA
ncbi:MAG: dehydrogenase, partial [Desulfitobacterium sp.]|nr:dehydrogenase [Desulfitobacterium sp.]